jgi:hypothetical protein
MLSLLRLEARGWRVSPPHLDGHTVVKVLTIRHFPAHPPWRPLRTPVSSERIAPARVGRAKDRCSIAKPPAAFRCHHRISLSPSHLTARCAGLGNSNPGSIAREAPNSRLVKPGTARGRLLVSPTVLPGRDAPRYQMVAVCFQPSQQRRITAWAVTALAKRCRSSWQGWILCLIPLKFMGCIAPSGKPEPCDGLTKRVLWYFVVRNTVAAQDEKECSQSTN